MTGLPLPVPPVFPAGYAPVVADFTNWVTDSLGFCTAGVMFRAEQQTAQSFSANTQTIVTFDTVFEDPYGGWSSGTHAWTAPVSGWYEVTSTLIIAASAGTLATQVFLSGTEQFTASAANVPAGNAGGAAAAWWVPMIAGTDFVQVRLLMTSAGATNATEGLRSTLEISFVSVQ